MPAQMRSPSFLSLAALLVALPILAAATDEFPTKPTIIGKGFVIVCCAQTPHPDVCYSTLARRANATRNEYARIARIAMRLNLKETQRFADRLTVLSRSASGPAKAALDGCLKDVMGAKSKIQDSHEKLWQARGWTGPRLEDTVYGIDAWISAALTSEQTCANRLKVVGAGLSNMDPEVGRGIESVRMGTANAMGLVYYYDSIVGSTSQEEFDVAEAGPLGPSP